VCPTMKHGQLLGVGIPVDQKLEFSMPTKSTNFCTTGEAQMQGIRIHWLGI